MASDIVFLAKTISNGIRLSKEKHTPSVCLQFTTVADCSDQPLQNFKPATMYADLYLTEAASGNALRTLREVFGWSGDSFKELNEPILAGKMVKLVCATDERGVLKVKFINRPGAFRPMSDTDLESLCAEIDKYIEIIKQSESEIAF